MKWIAEVAERFSELRQKELADATMPPQLS